MDVVMNGGAADKAFRGAWGLSWGVASGLMGIG